MADHSVDDGHESELGYTEEVVEYVDNRRQRAILVALLVVLFFLLIGISYFVVRLTRPPGAPKTASSGSSGMTWVRSIYGWGKGADQNLIAPTDVAIASDGTIWTLSEHRRIVGFNPDGTLKRLVNPQIGVSLEGIDVADNGDLFVADYAGQLIRFRQDGSVVATWNVQLPNEVDVRDNKIAVAAAYGIAVFTTDDQIIAKFGSRGSGADQFDLPHGIVLASDGSIFVSNTQNQRVEKFTPAGRLVWTNGKTRDKSKDWRSQDTSKTIFELPSGMTLDAKGRLVVVDPFKFQIIVLDANTGKQAREPSSGGKQGKLAAYGDYGTADGLFYYPTGIAYDKTRDWFAVADTMNNRIQIVRLPGSGGSVLAPIVGAFRLPMCIFCLPLILLLAALVVAAMRRRREKAQENAGAPAPLPSEETVLPSKGQPAD